MGFPRQKVKARRVAPSGSGNERVSNFFNRRRVPGLQIQNFREQRVPEFLIEENFVRAQRDRCDKTCSHRPLAVSVGAVLTLDDGPQGRGYSC
jgi:hypothetical protein